MPAALATIALRENVSASATTIAKSAAIAQRLWVGFSTRREAAINPHAARANPSSFGEPNVPEARGPSRYWAVKV